MSDDLVQESCRRERLLDEVRILWRSDGVLGADDANGHARQCLVRLHCRHDLPPIHDGHHEVEDDDAWRLLAHLVERLDAVLGLLDVVTSVRDCLCDDLAEGLVVIYYKDAAHVAF